MIEKSLQQFYELHKGKVSDKWSIYLSEYERIFSPYLGTKVRLLEIGVQNGGSLEIWSEFFPAAVKIVGCDVNPACAKLSFADPRISVIVGDANTEFVERKILDASSEFELIIDDGSHASGDIIRSFARYFPCVTDGGVFVVEDLHCSYWAEFDGGLFHPASSIAFFKRLVDIVNHEHWGVPAMRKDVLASFSRRYKFEIDDDVLSHIHSVEFLNSLCIIRKAEPSKNLLGTRFVAGTEELVASGHESLHQMRQSLIDESRNNWSQRSQLPEDEAESKAERILFLEQQLTKETSKLSLLRSAVVEGSAKLEALGKQLRKSEYEFSRLKRQHDAISSAAESQGVKLVEIPGVIEGYRRQVEELYASTSWRITAPLRWLSRQSRRALRMAKIVPPAIKKSGGMIGATRRATEILRDSGFQGIRRSASILEAEQSVPASTEVVAMAAAVTNSYSEWLKRYDPDPMDDSTRAEMRRRIEGMATKPLISIVMPTFNANPGWLRDAIESVRRQIYTRWELCIADDASPSVEARKLLQEYAARDTRIKVVFRSENGHIAAASNSALEVAAGEWIALMDHDDLLSEHALFWIADCINRNPDVKLIYSDEDKIDEQGVRSAPYFKSDWNVDLFYSHNMFSHLGVFNSELVKSIGGFRLGMQGSQDWDLVLRCMEHVSASQIIHVPRVLYHWRIHAESTAHSADAKPYAAIAGERALNEHLERKGLKAHVEYIGTGYRVHYALPVDLPLVTLIIPTRNGVELLRQCVDSILMRTTYENYEIIVVDNGSDDPETLKYLDAFKDSVLVSVVRDEQDFNFSALNNMAVSMAKGEIVGLINNDIEVISPEWLSEMVSLAIQPGIGAVGAKLWYPDHTIQHGGVVLGIGGVASHAHKGIPEGNNGYFGRAHLIQSFSAVTAACLVIKKDRYLSVGGLDEVNLTVAYNDVDFCLRLREAGFRNVWTPYAELFHHESATRGADIVPERQERFNRERKYMLDRWGALLEADPAYSPNLTLDGDDFSYAWPPRVELISSAHLQ